jgi:hypothetical protein
VTIRLAAFLLACWGLLGLVLGTLGGCGSVSPIAVVPDGAGRDAAAEVLPGDLVDQVDAATGDVVEVLPDAAAPDVGGDGAAADTSPSCLPGCVTECGASASSPGCAACTHPDGAAGIVCGCGPQGSQFCCCWTGALEHCTSRVLCQ